MKIEEKINEIKKLRNDGLSYREIGEKLGISHQSASNLAKRDLTTIGRREKSVTHISRNIRKIIEEYKSGIPITEIAEKYNACPAAIYQNLKREKIIIAGQRNRRTITKEKK